MKFNIFELRIVSFNSYVYYLTRGFIASTRAFNLLTRAFNLPARAFSVPTRAFNLATRAFSLLTRGFELVTRNSCFTFPRQKLVDSAKKSATDAIKLLQKEQFKKQQKQLEI